MAILQPVSSGHLEDRASPRTPEKPRKDAVDTSLVVTKISQQVKRPDRYSVYINERYSFSLSEYQLGGSGVRLGKTFTPDELAALQDESAFGKAYERTLRYVLLRPRSKYEIEQYLIRSFLYPRPKSYVTKQGERKVVRRVVDKTKAQAINQRVIDRLTEKGFVDDELFAQAWVRSRQLTKKLSRRKLKQELQAKRIDTEIIATVLQNIDNTEQENLAAVIAKKRRVSRYQDDVKLKQYLLRQGFNYEDIQASFRDATDES